MGPSFDMCGDMFEFLVPHPASSNTPATVQPALGTDSPGSDGEDKMNEDEKEDKTNEDKTNEDEEEDKMNEDKEDNLNTGSSKRKEIRVWADHLADNKKKWKTLIESANNG